MNFISSLVNQNEHSKVTKTKKKARKRKEKDEEKMGKKKNKQKKKRAYKWVQLPKSKKLLHYVRQRMINLKHLWFSKHIVLGVKGDPILTAAAGPMACNCLWCCSS